jgi:outer membrane protein TolC
VRSYFLLFFLFLSKASNSFCADQSFVVPLTLSELVNQVVRRNARAIYQKLQYRIASHQVEFERGIFDPSLFVNLKKERNHTPNTAQEAATRQFESEYKDQTELYEAGVGWLSRKGTEWKVDFSYDRHSSTVVDRFRQDSNEHTSGLKINVRQPLSRGKGELATQIKISLAKIEKKVSFDEYRKALMDLVGLAISNYWNLYGAQQLARSWDESLFLATKQLADARLRVKSGKASKVHLLELQVAVSQRKIELDSIRSKIAQLHNQIFGLLSVSAIENKDILFELRDLPEVEKTPIPDLELSYQLALRNWPEIQISKGRQKIEILKHQYAMKQVLPRIDMVANLSSNSLDFSASRSLGQFASGGFLSHFVGVEYSVAFDKTSLKQNLKMAELRLKQADLQIDSLTRTLYNSLLDKIETLSLSKSQMLEYKKALRLRRKLLSISKERMEYGKIGLRDHLEEQEKLIGHQRKNLSGIVDLKLSEATVQKAMGTLLSRFEVEVEELGNQDKLYDDGPLSFEDSDG